MSSSNSFAGTPCLPSLASAGFTQYEADCSLHKIKNLFLGFKVLTDTSIVVGGTINKHLILLVTFENGAIYKKQNNGRIRSREGGRVVCDAPRCLYLWKTQVPVSVENPGTCTCGKVRVQLRKALAAVAGEEASRGACDAALIRLRLSNSSSRRRSS